MSLLKGKRKTPNIIRGGRAIPFGNPTDNLYYLQGRSHAKGGIDIGENPRTGIEAEGGEVVQIKPNELRVLSAQDFIGGGISPAKQVLAGANPDRVFNEQERFKDRHRINDDGSKYDIGGDRQLTHEDKLRLVREWRNNPTYEGGILPQTTIAAPMTWKARNAIKSRKGRKAFYEGQAEAAPLMLGLAGLGVGASLAANGLLGATLDGASIISNPTDPLNYIPYTNNIHKYLEKVKMLPKDIIVDIAEKDVYDESLHDYFKTQWFPRFADQLKEEKKVALSGLNKPEKYDEIEKSFPIEIPISYDTETLNKLHNILGRDISIDEAIALTDYRNKRASVIDIKRRAKKAKDYVDNPDNFKYNIIENYIDENGNKGTSFNVNDKVYITKNHANRKDVIAHEFRHRIDRDNDFRLSPRLVYELNDGFATDRLPPELVGDSKFIEEKIAATTEPKYILFEEYRKRFGRNPTKKELGKALDGEKGRNNIKYIYSDDFPISLSSYNNNYLENAKIRNQEEEFYNKAAKLINTVPAIGTGIIINQNNQKRNGGMIASINGNIKNGLIVTPRKKCGGRKKAPYGTVRDVNTRGVAAPDLWLNTIGQDNAVYDMAVNNTIEGNRMAMRHADMREDLGYQSGSGRAIRGSGQVRQYQQDFQNRFWDANRKLYNAIDPAGNTGDNQSGQFNDDIWGEETNVRAPYGLWSDKNRQMWNDKGFLAANYKGNTVLTGRIANLNDLELPGRPGTPQLTAPKGELLDMPSPTGGNAETPTTPQSPTPRRGIRWNDDLTSALANGLGSLGSFGADLWGANLRSWTPYTESPVKLKTNWNINPQLDRIRESSQEAYRDIDANTASSSTALARKQRVRNQAQYAANEQWGLKENKETELINKNKLNLQGVRNRNTNRLNHWAESDANIANMRRRLRGAAWSNLFDNLNKTVQGYIGRRDQRRRDEATERMFNRAYPHGAAMARNIQSRESSGDATIPSLATNPIAIAGRLATERLDDDIVAKTKKRCGGKTKRK